MRKTLLALQFELEAGCDIVEAAALLIQMADRLTIRVRADFNGVLLMAQPGDDAGGLVDSYRYAMKRGYDHARDGLRGKAPGPSDKARFEDEVRRILSAPNPSFAGDYGQGGAWGYSDTIIQELWLMFKAGMRSENGERL